MSVDPIDRYLAEFAAALTGSRRHRRRVLGDVENHLRDAASDLLAAGATPEQAALGAVRRFGEPEAAARILSRSRPARGRIGLAAACAITVAGAGALVYAVHHPAPAARLAAPNRGMIDNQLGGRVAITTRADGPDNRGLLTAQFLLDGHPLTGRPVFVAPLTGGRPLVAYTDLRGRVSMRVAVGCYAVKLGGTRMPGLDVPSPANQTFHFKVYTAQIT